MSRIVGKRLLVAFFLVVLGLPLALRQSAPGALAAPLTGPDVTPAVHSDVSPPLRDIAPQHATGPQRQVPLHRTPLASPKAPAQADPAAQSAPGGPATSTVGLNFAGVGQSDYGYTDQVEPPDTNGAVGASQYVQWVNIAFAIFDKSTGALTYGPADGNTLWKGFGGGCEANNDGDPIVKYDQLAQRWVLTQFSISTTPYLQCVAISTTSDALGSYYRYAFSYNNNFNDYGKLGIWPDAYYITFNMFPNGAPFFAGPEVCAYDRSKMLQGLPAAQVTQQCFGPLQSAPNTPYGTLLPSDLDGSNPPPAGAPNYVMNFGANNTSLNVWKFHVDWTTPNNSTLTGPTSIPVAPFSPACNGGQCIPQPGGANPLDSLGDRLMYRLAYRHFADGHEALVVNHSVTVNSATTGVRWYELRLASGTPIVYQLSTFVPNGTSRWMGSIAMDGAGDIALGYSASSTSVFPSIAYTGRVPTDPAGQMQAETIIKAGLASQPKNFGLQDNRWGDYSAMTIDPVDDCTFWYTNEYLKTSADFNWSTQIASFKFANCQPSQVATTLTTPAMSAPYNGTVTLQATLTANGAGVAGKTVAFVLNHNPVGTATTGANGVATLNNVSLTGIAAGRYPAGVSVTFSGDGAYNGSSASSTLTVTSGQARHFLVSAPASTTVGTAVNVTVTGQDEANNTAINYTGTVQFTSSDTLAVLPAAYTFTGADQGVHTFSVTFKSGGAQTLKVADTTNSTVTGSASVNVAKLDQTITFGPLPNRTTTDPPFTVSATPSSGLPVSFTASGVCTVSGNTVTLTGAAGPCAVTAQQAGNATYNAAPDVTQTFSVQAPVPMVTLVVQTAGTGSGTVTPGVGSHSYPNTATATLSATAASGSTFTGWTVDGTFVGFGVPLTLPMTLSHTVTATFMTTPAFPDVPASNPYAPAISQLAARGIIKGYANGQFGPGDTLLRAQAAALAARPFGWQTLAAPNPFPDRCAASNPFDCVDAELWNDIGVLNSKNVARGYPDPLACAPFGTTAPCYLPRTAVLHIQVVSLITRAMEAAGYWQAATVDDPSLFANVPASTGARLDLVTYAHYVGPYTDANGLPLLPTLSGTGQFPGYDQPATRGYAAQVIWQAYAAYWSTNHLP